MAAICTTPRCPCSENPLANLSSERPDHPIWVGMSWQQQVPFLGAQWSGSQCDANCFSEIDQYDADRRAQRAAVECIPESCIGADCVPCNPPCDPCQGPQCAPATKFCNVAQGCQDAAFSSSIAACEVVAHTQADADAIAASICQERLRDPALGRRTPNVPGCPVILAMFPASPVHANEGETVVLSAGITYTGPGPLEFLWSLDGFPVAITSTAILTLSNVSVADSGTYTMAVSAPGCAALLSPPAVLDVTFNAAPGGPLAP